jgi:hypothetical protein
VADLDAEVSKAAEGLLRMGLSRLAIAMLVVADPFGNFPVHDRAGRGRQGLPFDPSGCGIPNLLDGQVQTRSRFFL